VPAAWDLHPEFGLLCISARFRRTLQVGLLFIAGALVAGVLASNFFVGGDLADVRREFALAPAPALHGKGVRGGGAERVVSRERHAGAEASINRGVHSCTNGAWLFLDRSCTFGSPGKIRRVRSLSAPPALATAFMAHASAPSLPLTHTALPNPPRASANPESSASSELSAGSSAQRHARVQGHRSTPGARTVWGPIW